MKNRSYKKDAENMCVCFFIKLTGHGLSMTVTGLNDDKNSAMLYLRIEPRGEREQ